MKKIEEMAKTPGLKILQLGSDGFRGILKYKQFVGSVIVSWGKGWEHVSVSHKNPNYIPSWNDMCAFKEMFFKDDEWAMQFHPPVSEYVNNMPNCLHLWRPTKETMPTPPSILTGFKGARLTNGSKGVKA